MSWFTETEFTVPQWEFVYVLNETWNNKNMTHWSVFQFDSFNLISCTLLDYYSASDELIYYEPRLKLTQFTKIADPEIILAG